MWQFSWSSRKTRHNQSNYWWIKNNLPKKHLYCTIDELFNLFKGKYPNIKIGRSKFAELRLPYVLLLSAMPTCACVCRYHENFIKPLWIKPFQPIQRNSSSLLYAIQKANRAGKTCATNVRTVLFWINIMYLAIAFYCGLVGKMQLWQIERKNFKSYQH